MARQEAGGLCNFKLFVLGLRGCECHFVAVLFLPES